MAHRLQGQFTARAVHGVHHSTTGGGTRMGFVRSFSVVMTGLVLFGASGCGNSTLDTSLAASDAAARASEELDRQRRQDDPLLKQKGTKKHRTDNRLRHR